jgi:hypothetical protein
LQDVQETRGVQVGSDKESTYEDIPKKKERSSAVEISWCDDAGIDECSQLPAKDADVRVRVDETEAGAATAVNRKGNI